MSLTQEQITLFDLALENRRNIPFRVLQALHDMPQAEKTSVERILFEHGGVSVFAAYVFANSMNSHRAQDRGRTLAEFKSLVGYLEALSVESLQAVAVQLKGMMIGLHQVRIEKMIDISRSRAIKESRLLTTPSDGAETEKSEGDTGFSGLDSKQITLLQMAIKSRRKLPHQCTEALKQASKAKIKTTERIFFENGGLVACAAYILTKYETNKTKARQKAGRVRLLALLEGLPIEARQSAALQLAAAMEPDKEQIARVVEKAYNSKWYAQEYHHRRPTTPSEDAQKDASLRKPNECGDTMDLRSTRQTSSEPAHQASGHSVSHSRHDISQSPRQDAPHLHNHSEPLLSSSSANNDEHKFANASIAACNDVFPDHLVEAIERNSEQGHTSANVTILFLHGNTGRALLRIQVTSEKIE